MSGVGFLLIDEGKPDATAGPFVGSEPGERGAGDAAAAATVDALDVGADAPLGLAQMAEIALVLAVLGLTPDQHGERVIEVELLDVGDILLLLEGLGHAGSGSASAPARAGFPDAH